MAWLAFNDLWWLAIIAATLAVTAGWVLDAAGAGLLPKHPVAAVRLLEWWILVPIMVAAVAGALVIILTVAFTLPEGTGDETKEVVGAVSAAITGFLTASFVSWASDDKDSQVADHISECFQARYKRIKPGETPQAGVHYFPADSDGERWVYSEEFKGIEGWGSAARRKRAAGIADALGAAASNRPA